MPTAKKKAKRPFPGTPPTFTVTLQFTLMHDFDRYSNGGLAWRIMDTSATWEPQPPGLPEKGEVGGAIGGAFYFAHGGRSWRCTPDVSAPALVAAEAAQYLKTRS